MHVMIAHCRRPHCLQVKYEERFQNGVPPLSALRSRANFHLRFRSVGGHTTARFHSAFQALLATPASQQRKFCYSVRVRLFVAQRTLQVSRELDHLRAWLRGTISRP